MIDQLISFLQQLLLDWFHYPWIVILLLAALPIVEARLAIPMAIKFGYSGMMPFLLGYFGSALLAPLLLLVLIPFIKWLSKTKVFKKLGETLFEKFAKKSAAVDENASCLKKMLCLAAFVAIPLPLTGIWTGCAVASIIKLPYAKSLISVLTGNLVACSILAVLGALFSETVINYIILCITIIAIILVIALLIKALIRKPQNDNSAASQGDESKN